VASSGREAKSEGFAVELGKERCTKAGDWLTIRDLERSATAHLVPELLRVLRQVRTPVDRYLDVGCGFGGLTRLVADRLSAKEIWGIDIDENALLEAAQKGVQVRRVDVGSETLPFEAAYFDLVTAFGMLDYLPYFDGAVREFFRVLRPGGYLLIALPNLGSWHNRLALMFGFQPRDVEISSQKLVGTAGWYKRRGDRPVGHIHTATVRAMQELLGLCGFRLVVTVGARYPGRELPWLVRVIDWLACKRPGLARRVFYLAQKGTPERSIAAVALAACPRGISELPRDSETR
jgi:SAM-dependent methyltransferase